MVRVLVSADEMSVVNAVFVFTNGGMQMLKRRRLVVERESSAKNEIQMRAMGRSKEVAQVVPNPLNAAGGEAKADDGIAVHAASSVVKKSLTIDFRFEDLGLQLKGSGISVLNGVTGEIK